MTMIEGVTPAHVQQHEIWKAAHARLNPAQPKKPNVIALVAPTTKPAADVMDFIIAAVGNSMGLPVNQILTGVSTPETISARKLAMALCVRRPRFAIERVAGHFEASDEAVRDSLSLLDPILSAYAITSKTPLELSMPIILREWALTIDRLRRNPSIREIQIEVCKAFDISRNEVLSPRKHQNIVRVRRAAMALCKQLTTRSFPEIGLQFGGRDHTTIIYATRRFKPIMDAVVQKISPDTSIAGWVAAVQTEMTITPLTKSIDVRWSRR